MECSAVPLELLETALQNLHMKKKQLLSDEEKENFAGNCTFLKFCLFMHVVFLDWEKSLVFVPSRCKLRISIVNKHIYLSIL